MLVLSRKQGDSLVCVTKSGEVINVYVVDVGKKSSGVRIGIDTDRATTIYRKELYDRIQEGSEDGLRQT